MRAQIKKEMLEAAYPVAVLFAGLCWAWLGMLRFEDVLLAPSSKRCFVVVGTAVAAGALIGFVQFAAERWRGTIGFAVHRARGHAGLFVAKAVVGIAATLLLAIGPVLVFAACQLLFSANGPILQSERLVEYAIYGLSGASAYALGVLASQLHRGWWLDLSVLALGSLGVFGVTVLTLWSAGESMVSAVLVYLLVQAAMTGGLWMLAVRLMRGARDRSLTLPRGQFAALTGVGFFFFVLPATTLVSGALEVVREQMLVDYPIIAQHKETGEFSTMDRGSPDLVEYEYSRETHGYRARESKYRHVYSPTWGKDESSKSRPPEFPRHGPRRSALVPQWDPTLDWLGILNLESIGSRYTISAFFDNEKGVVRVFWIERRGNSNVAATHADRSPLTQPLGREYMKDGGRGRFSRSTIQTRFDQEGWGVVDLEDLTVWSLDPMRSPELFELHLPNADRLVRVEPYYHRASLFVGMYSPYKGALLFVGEKGSYVWRNGQFEAFTGTVLPDSVRVSPPGEPVPSSQAEDWVTLRVRATDPDPIQPRIEVLDAKSGKVLFAHQYAPQTLTANVSAALLYAGTLLRMPIGCLYSFAQSTVEPDGMSVVGGVRAQEEPLLLRGHRPWLLCLNLAVATLCTTSLVRRMKRRGADRITILSSTVIVALFGVVAYVYLRGLLPKRTALVVSGAPSTEARVLLIQSA